jgi:tellurite resistance protein TerC
MFAAGALATRASAAENFAEFTVHPWQWAAFVAFITALLVIDLLVVHRRPHAVTAKEAAIESAVWITIGLSFSLVFLWWHGGAAASEYLAGYLIEKSLSVDNVFVWAVLLSYFGIPKEHQFRVLFWGVFGALLLRAVFIFTGVALIETFEWVLYGFGAFLIYTAWKIARHDGAQVHPESNLMLKLVGRVVPTSNELDGQKLVTKIDGKRVVTPLFAALVMIESTDVIFAVDSIPAILAVAREQFVVFSSNAFAILGLRSLYFLFADMADRFRYLNTGLGVILAFVGAKMLLASVYHLPIWLSLVVIVVVLAVTVVASMRADRRSSPPPRPADPSPAGDQDGALSPPADRR